MADAMQKFSMKTQFIYLCNLGLLFVVVSYSQYKKVLRMLAYMY